MTKPKPPHSSGIQRWAQVNLLNQNALLLHAGLFTSAALVGIARYSRAMPAELTAMMAVWSIALLVHGLLLRRTSKSDGIVNTLAVAISANGVMWALWALATDAQDASPWHLTIWIVLASAVALGAIAGKRALYRHWLQQYRNETAHAPNDTKAKREPVYRLDDDGELTEMVDEGRAELRNAK